MRLRSAICMQFFTTFLDACLQCLPSAFAALFAAAIAYNRLELTISRDDKWQAAKEIEMVTTLMHKLNSIILGKRKDALAGDLRYMHTWMGICLPQASRIGQHTGC